MPASYPEFRRRWRINLHADGYPGSDNYLNTALILNWRPSPGWDFGIGSRYIDRKVKDGDVANELQVGDIMLSVTHRFY